MLKAMLKEEAIAKKAASKEKLGIELSTSPFEQKFADLRPTVSASTSPQSHQSQSQPSHHHPHTPRQGEPKESARPREPRLKASTIVRKELSDIFEDVYDAWAFVDLKRKLEVHPSSLIKGLERLGISVDSRKLVQELDKDVYDGNVSVREFIKGLAWHDVPSGPDAAQQINSILDEAMKRQSTTIDTALRTAAYRNTRSVARVNPASLSPSPPRPGSSRRREAGNMDVCFLAMWKKAQG
jgi:hypothetical protein